MNNFESQQLRPMPFPKPLSKMSDVELSKLLTSNSNYNVLIPALIESNNRKDKIIAELLQRVTFLESKTLKKAGRKRQTFYFNGQELTDEYLEYLIDYDYITIPKLEKDVGAGKNQLRNRYNKIKQQKKLQKEINSHDYSYTYSTRMLYSGTIHIFTGNYQKLLAGSSFRRYDSYTSQRSG